MSNNTINGTLINNLSALPSKIFQMTFQNLPFGFAIIDSSGIIKYANLLYATIFNKKVEEIIDKDFFSLFSFESKADKYDEFNRIFTSVEPPTWMEEQITLWNRKSIWVKYNQVVIDLNDQKFLLHFIEDITSNKIADLEIQKNAIHYKTVFNNTSDAILLCNLNYGKTLSNFFDSNDEAIKRLKFSKAELFQQNPVEIIFEGNEAESINMIDKLRADGNYIFTTSITSKYNENIPSEINSYQFDYGGRPAIVFIARDLTERNRFESQLKSYGENLRHLALHLQSVREEERTIIAREIHDELGQVLTVLKIQISLLAKKLIPFQPDLQIKFDSITEIIDSSVETVQKICEKLRPSILDDLGISAAIEWQAKEFSKRTGIECNLEIPKEEIEIEPEKKTAVFRIFQEALTNIARHANANRVLVMLNWDDEELNLSIKDNGKGITKNQIQNSKSLGLLGMKERALLLGGLFEIKSTMGSGTIVKLQLPIKV